MLDETRNFIWESLPQGTETFLEILSSGVPREVAVGLGIITGLGLLFLVRLSRILRRRASVVNEDHGAAALTWLLKNISETHRGAIVKSFDGFVQKYPIKENTRSLQEQLSRVLPSKNTIPRKRRSKSKGKRDLVIDLERVVATHLDPVSEALIPSVSPVSAGLAAGIEIWSGRKHHGGLAKSAGKTATTAAVKVGSAKAGAVVGGQAGMVLGGPMGMAVGAVLGSLGVTFAALSAYRRSLSTDLVKAIHHLSLVTLDIADELHNQCQILEHKAVNIRRGLRPSLSTRLKCALWPTPKDRLKLETYRCTSELIAVSKRSMYDTEKILRSTRKAEGRVSKIGFFRRIAGTHESELSKIETNLKDIFMILNELEMILPNAEKLAMLLDDRLKPAMGKLSNEQAKIAV